MMESHEPEAVVLRAWVVHEANLIVSFYYQFKPECEDQVEQERRKRGNQVTKADFFRAARSKEEFLNAIWNGKIDGEAAD